MKKQGMGIVLLLLAVLAISYFIYHDYIKENEGQQTIFIEDKLTKADFTLDKEYYIRTVEENGIVYEEFLSISNNAFMRIINNSTEREVYSYDYDNDIFVYMYYFEGELISTFKYDYKKDEVLLDEADVYDALVDEIVNLKKYFNKILADNDIELSEI